jgi:hypothetical protein
VFLEMAEVGVERADRAVGEAARALAQDPPDVPAARRAANEAVVACRETAAGLAGLRKFLALLSFPLRQHPLAAGGTLAVALATGAALWALWPVRRADAGASVRPDDRAAEQRALALLQDHRFAEAEAVLDAELDTPRGWHLRGEMWRMRGDEAAAVGWYRRAAAAGERYAVLALEHGPPSGRTRSGPALPVGSRGR